MSMQHKSLEAPDEARSFTNGEMAVVDLGGLVVGRGVMQPGWRWSEDIKPIAGTDSCEVPHTGYVVSGRVHVQMDDGSEAEFGPGDVYVIPPGHDGWVVGDEPYVTVEWSGTAATFAKQANG
jgi:hypothetical protein